MTFHDHRHAVWRELLQCEPMNAEDESALSGYLRWMEAVENESDWARDRLIDITNFLEERAFLMSRMTPAQRQEADAYRRARAVRQQRDSWQKSAPRTLTKAEHDELLGVEVGATKAVDREEYERMMREAQQ